MIGAMRTPMEIPTRILLSPLSDMVRSTDQCQLPVQKVPRLVGRLGSRVRISLSPGRGYLRGDICRGFTVLDGIKLMYNCGQCRWGVLTRRVSTVHNVQPPMLSARPDSVDVSLDTSTNRPSAVSTSTNCCSYFIHQLV